MINAAFRTLRSSESEPRKKSGVIIPTISAVLTILVKKITF